MSPIAPGVPVPATPGTATSYGATPLAIAVSKSTSTTATPTTTTATPTTTTATPTTPVATPTPTTTSSAQCPAGSSGPFCLTGTQPHTSTSPAPLPATQRTNLTDSSRWVAEQLQSSLHANGIYGQFTMTDGVVAPKGTPPYIPSSGTAAATIRKAVVASVGDLPIANNSKPLDNNVYELAVDWASGYSPQPNAAACVPVSATPTPVATVISGPPTVVGTQPTTVQLSKQQVTVAFKVVAAAKGAGANTETEVALVAASLAGGQLGGAQPSTGKSKGVFGTGSSNLTSAVAVLTAKMVNTSLPPATRASQALGPSPSFYTGWIAGATQLVDTANSVSGVCSGAVGSGTAALAIRAAEGEVGKPYVWGGGGFTGPSLGSSGLGATACSNGVVTSDGNQCVPPYTKQTGQPGFDCSGLVQFAYHVAGINIPRTSELQDPFVKAHGSWVSNIKDLQPGDLMFYSFTPGTVDHVAMYIGSGELIQAPETGEDVQIVPVYKTGFVGGGAP